MTDDVSQNEPVQSIEVKDQGKINNEEEQKVDVNNDAEASDNENENDAPGDGDDEGIEVTDLTDGKTAGDLYKSFKAITEVLLNYKTKSRGNE